VIRFLFIAFTLLAFNDVLAQKRVRDYGIEIGVLSPGINNAITDVQGVLVGHVTLWKGRM